MDASRFDAWTRRRFGLTVGGGVASLIGLSALDAEAKKKHKHKKKNKCKKLKASCGGKHKCCEGLFCDESEVLGGLHCCQGPQTACTNSNECCSPSLCSDNLCCAPVGAPCTEDTDCCAGSVCDDVTNECAP